MLKVLTLLHYTLHWKAVASVETFSRRGGFFGTFLGIFWKILTEKIAFFRRAPPPSLKISYIDSKGAFRNVFEVGQPKMDIAKLY